MPPTVQGEDLTGVILKLLLAWRDPLSQFHRSMAQHEDFTSISGNKALEMSDMVQQLRMGVERVAETVRERETLPGIMSAAGI